MKASNFSDAQKAFILKQGDDSVLVAEICRKAGISQTDLFQLSQEVCRSAARRDASSSDGQYFPAGGHAEAIGDLNARYGPNPGTKFYRFTSDQYGTFYIIAMNANASEAIYVLDGLVNGQTPALSQ